MWWIIINTSNDHKLFYIEALGKCNKKKKISFIYENLINSYSGKFLGGFILQKLHSLPFFQLFFNQDEWKFAWFSKYKIHIQLAGE